MTAPEIEVVPRGGGWQADMDDPDAVCRNACRAAWQAAGAAPLVGVVAIALADDAEVADLNRRYGGCDGPTNVLSFAYPAEEPRELDAAGWPPELAAADRPIGDIIVAYETAAAEARAETRPLADHLSRLVIHGMLHLLGHDHQTPAEAADMEAVEARALAAVGAADPEAPLLTRSHEPIDSR